MEKIYISGKITGLDNYAELFKNAQNLLIEQGYEVINPVELDHTGHDQSWESFMKVDLKALINCDSIFMLKNWNKSKGAIVEYHLARDLNMNIYYQ